MITIIPMLNWYFRWRSRRQHKTSSYKIDDNVNKPLFGPGFTGHLQPSRLWRSKLGKYENPRKGRRYIFLGFIIIVIVLGIWVMIETIKAINFF